MGVPFLRKVLRLLGVARDDLDDVLQDVLIAAYRALDRYDATRYARAPPVVEREGIPVLDASLPPFVGFQERRGWDPLLAWLFGIAWRQVSHYRERAYRRREVPMGLHDNWIFAGVDDHPDLEQHVEGEERAQLVGMVLSRLDPQRRVVLVMHDMLDVPVVDVAGELGVNENTAQNRLRLAREDFRAGVARLTAEKRGALSLGARPKVAEAPAAPRPAKPREPPRE